MVMKYLYSTSNIFLKFFYYSVMYVKDFHITNLDKIIELGEYDNKNDNWNYLQGGKNLALCKW